MQSKMVKIIILFVIIAFLSSCGFDYKIDNDLNNKSKENENNSSLNIESKEKSGIKKYKIGISLLDLRYAFVNELKIAMQDEAEKKGVELLFTDAKGSAQNQMNNILLMINEKVDAIILNPVDAVECVEVVRRASTAHIPVIGVNTIVNSEKLISYIGSNDVEVGKLQMKFIADYLNGKGNVVLVGGSFGQSSTLQRTEGMHKILRNYPNLNLLASAAGNWKRNEARIATEELLNKLGMDINAIICQNDEMALGAIDALNAKGMRNRRDQPVMGVDAISDAVQSIEDGTLNATVFLDAVAQGKAAIDVTTNFLNGEKVAQIYYIPVRLLTKEILVQEPNLFNRLF